MARPPRRRTITEDMRGALLSLVVEVGVVVAVGIGVLAIAAIFTALT